MEYLTKERAFDWVYLVISPQNPFKDPSKALNAEQRYRAAIAAVRRHPELHVWVDNIELSMDPPHYTIRTLDALRRREPDNEFTLVVGADNLANFTGWRDYRRILREYGLLVFPRKGFHRGHLKARLLREDPAYRITLAAAPRVDISSSEIRAAAASGRDMARYLM